MIVIALQSGSNGNCIYVETGRTKLLFDAGISGHQAEKRLASFGRDIRRVNAVIISHDHADHISSAGVYQRKFALPLYMTEPTLSRAMLRTRVGRLNDIRHFKAGETLLFEDMYVETVPTPHDCADGCAFVLEDSRSRCGILTDLGNVFEELVRIVSTLDAVLIESNYDEGLLESGPYPPFLKQRIHGDKGHISNVESAELLSRSASPQLVWACLSHLSELNNTPALAIEAHRGRLPERIKLITASRYGAVMLPEL
ncbi:MAG TPA: MBL fold metallo-hydrolase [Spirochaetes bacterium]|nr:MBL fold metallo-hydrolase [Spirochaetota bacterium]